MPKLIFLFIFTKGKLKNIFFTFFSKVKYHFLLTFRVFINYIVYGKDFRIRFRYKQCWLGDCG